MDSDPHNLAGQKPSQEEGLHPSSELAKFFPNLVQGNSSINPMTSSPPPIIPNTIPQTPPHHMYPAPPPHIPYQPDMMPGSPHTPYYSNMYLARQNSQKLPYPPSGPIVPNPSSPPPPGYAEPPFPYMPSPVPPYHSPIPSHSPVPVHVPIPIHHPVPVPVPVPAPSPIPVPVSASPAPSPASTLVYIHPTPTSSTESKSKPKKERTIGTRLAGMRNTYQLDSKDSKPKRQLEATPVTLYNSSGEYLPGALIAANHNYICYAIKGDLVRVLSRHTPARTLLRGHTESIVELAFFQAPSPSLSSSSDQSSVPAESVDLLASTAKDGNIFLWKLDTPSAESVTPVLVLNLYSATRKSNGYFHRVCWHPTDSNVLAAVSSEPGGGIYIFHIPPLLTIAQNKPNSQCDIDQLDTAGVNILQIPDTAVVQDVAFSPNGALLAAGYDDGRVRVWDLQTKECIYDWLDNVEQQATGEQDTQPINSVLFPCNSVLVTSTHKNSTVHLWSLPAQQTSAQPTYLQSIVFKHQTKEFLGHLAFDPTGSFLFLASTSLCVGFILHLDAAINKDKDNRTYVPKFDYLTEFEVTQPILSFTVGLQNAPQKPTEDGEEDTEKRDSNILQLFCVQTKAIQIHQTSADQCYSTSKQTAEDDIPGPLTQIGKVGEHASNEPDVHPPLSNSAETRRILATEEYNQQQQNLWLSHSVEAGRDSYGPDEQYQDPAFSPLAPPSVPAFPTAPQPTALLEKLEQNGRSLIQEQDQSNERLKEELQSQPKDEPQAQPKDESQAQPQEEFVVQSQDQVQEAAPKPEDSETPQQNHPEELIHEKAQKEYPVHANDTEKQVQEPQQPASMESEKSQGDQIEQPQPHTDQPIKQEESQNIDSAYQETKQETPIQEQDKFSTESTLSPQASQSASQTTPTKAPKTRGGRNKKENSAHIDQSTPETARQVPTANAQSHQPKQKTSAAITTILHRNSPATQETTNALRSVSPSAATSAPIVQDDLRKLEANIMTRMEKLFIQQLDKQYARLDKEREERERREKERQERLLAVISQTLNTSIQQQLERIIRKELSTELEKLSKDVVQAVEGVVTRTVQETVKKSAPSTVAKLDQRSMDALFKEALEKAIPQMRAMIAESLRQPIQQSFVQYFQDKLIPAFDQSCKVMFTQLSSTFEDGIQDLISSQKPTDISGSGGLNNSNTVLADQLRVTVQTLLDVTSSMSSSIVETQNKILASHQAHPTPQSTQPALPAPPPSPHTSHLPPHPSQPHQPHPHSQPTHQPTSAPLIHPAPTYHHPQPHFASPPPASASGPHATLSRLVSMGRYEEAFDTALSLSNLSVVTWLCNHIGDPKSIFPSGSLLITQPVLLSLVQQLGYDLDTDTMVKCVWLSAVIPFVDPKSPQVPEHQVRDVFVRLSGKLDESYHKYADPSSPYSHVFQLLYQVVVNKRVY